MIRRQAYIEDAQQTFRKRQAKALGVTPDEFIRRGIDSLRHLPVRAPVDPQAWRDVFGLLEERAGLPSCRDRRLVGSSG